MAERSLRILQVSTTDLRGGAEKVAWDLFTAYRSLGLCSWLAVGEKRSADPNVFPLPHEEFRGVWYRSLQKLSQRFMRRQGASLVPTSLSRLSSGLSEPLRRLEYHFGLEDFHYPGTSQLLNLTGQRPDILHAHNLHGYYFDLRMLPNLSRRLPVLLTLHDAWLLSGHCAHSFECEKWRTGCGRCPDLTIYPQIERDATWINWRRKRSIYARSRLYLATPSRWLMEKVEKSILAPAVVEARVLPNGVDQKVFHPGDKQAARAALGIAPEALVLIAVGVKLRENRWKDYPTLQEAFFRAAGLAGGKELALVVLGEEAPPVRVGGSEIRFVPFQETSISMSLFYQASDIYLHAARVDTFPTSVLEAMACGTPVVATAVGGIPEQIEDGVTGFLVPGGDAAGMAGRTVQILADDHLKLRLGEEAARRARQRFSLDRQVNTYINWYEELIRQNGVKAAR